jgi:hypothetical protein
MGFVLFSLWIILSAIFEKYTLAIGIGCIIVYFFSSYIAEYKLKAKKYEEILPEFNELKANKMKVEMERQNLYEERNIKKNLKILNKSYNNGQNRKREL